MRPSFPLAAGLLSFIAAAPATRPVEKLAVPRSLEQMKPDQAVHAQYKDDFAARDVGAKAALSHKLLEAATVPSIDAPMHWVLLREAREQAIDAGDLNGAFATIDAMNDAFIIDPRTAKVSAMTAALDKAMVPPVELADTYLKLVDSFLDDGDIDLAHNAAQLASDAARNARDASLKPRLMDADKRIAAARREAAPVTAALRKLRANPTDPDASLTVGKYACFIRAQWSKGLPLLAQCNDSKLKALAEQELENPSDAPAQVKLGDAWSDYAKTLSGPAATKTHQHAATWYEKALPALTGAEHDAVERKLQSEK